MAVSNLQARLSAAQARFLKLYGSGQVSILRAPARINILGEHVDYVSYFPTASLPFASREHAMFMLFRAVPDDRIRGASSLGIYPPFEFRLADGPLNTSWLDYLHSRPLPEPHWSNYVKGAAYYARLNHGTKHGFDFLIDSAIPPGGGASSSSALTVLAGAAIREVNGIEYQLDELARESSQAEWYLGTRGGAMDHVTICLARRGHAVHISYPDHRARLLPLPDRGFRWVTFFTHAADKGREVMLEYNERSAVSRLLIPAIIEGWNQSRPDLADSLRQALDVMQSEPIAALGTLETLFKALPAEIPLAELERSDPEVVAECRRGYPSLVEVRHEHPLKLRDRALHHVGETRRVEQAARLLSVAHPPESAAETDSAMRELGLLINSSHASLRDLYEVSTPEVDRLIDLILAKPGLTGSVPAEPEVYGARLMGAGFGGNVLALVKEENVASLIARVQADYYGPRDRDGAHEGAVMISTPGDGLSRVEE
ncbi:MAG TPA: galactokinase family protein [Blastocatellia bacterium]|nr:galactokinase family protein [Blastocatellia bacterium]